MQSTGAGDRPHSTRDRILEAAAEEFRSPDYQWGRGLVVQRVADRASVAEDTVYNIFGTKDGLLGELVLYLIAGEPADSDDDWSVERFDAQAEQNRDGGATAVFELVRAAIDNLGDRASFGAQAFLVAQARHDPRVRRAAAESYRQWDQAIIGRLLGGLERSRYVGVSQRLGMEAREMAIILSALVEGLVMRAQATDDIDAVSLAEKSVAGLMSAWIAFDGDDAPFGAQFDEYERRHRTGESGQAQE
ncbi:MAG: hypothetical protein AAF467_19760 [Actinomycetota bacterium]